MEAIAAPQLAALNPVVAQAIALATHANVFLRRKAEEPAELLGSHSAFRTTFEITFDRLGPADRPFALADGPAPWFRRLQKEDISRMRLVLHPWELEKANRVSGVAEPIWGLVTEGDVGTEVWAPNWNIRPGINPKQEAAPWRVSWQGEKIDRTILRGDEPIEQALVGLEQAFAGIAAIVRAAGTEIEKATFESLVASARTGGAILVLGQYPDLFEECHYRPPARRLGLVSAVAIGLFISAGWKDRHYDSETLQKAFVSARAKVWQAAKIGIQSAVNTLAD